MILAVDFDGTITENGYWPDIGPELPYMKSALTYLHALGHKIIINSCRADEPEKMMVTWLAEHEIPVDAVNMNLPERAEAYGGDCRKISADLYIDDRAIFCRGISWRDIVREVEAREAEIMHRRLRREC